MAFKVARNYGLIRLHTPDGEARWSIESDKSKMPTLADMRKLLTTALDMIDRFEARLPPPPSPVSRDSDEPTP